MAIIEFRSLQIHTFITSKSLVNKAVYIIQCTCHVHVQNNVHKGVKNREKISDKITCLRGPPGPKVYVFLLEDRTNQVAELKEQLNLKNDEIENLKEQLSEEKSKGFFAKIFGRK